MTKIQIKIKEQEKIINEYIFPLAMQIKEKLENEDIELCISTLSDYEKEILRKRLLEMKVEVKTPADYRINKTIYLTIAIIMDKSVINRVKEKNILKSKKR